MYLDKGELGIGRTVITIAGQIGSGKSAVCRQLHQQTNWEVISAGAIMRRAATRSGMSILQMNEYATSHSEIDAEVDNYLISLRKGINSIIVDSRLAWHFIPSSLKVYLVVDPYVGAQRIFEATRVDEKYPSVEIAYADSIERQRLETERYMELYSVDCQSWHNYHVIIDTTHASPEQTAALILNKVKRFQNDELYSPECWLSPKRLMPTKKLPEITGHRMVSVRDKSSRQEYDMKRLVDIGVFKGFYFIIKGHRRVSAAIINNESLVRCRLIAFESEEISPGLSLESVATTSTSLLLTHHWEETNGFRFVSYPSWLAEGQQLTAKPPLEKDHLE
jgi:cytidylate kinase